MADLVPANPTRVIAFTKFFKGYMNLWAVVAASLPIPLTEARLIPMYKAQRGYLSVYTTLLCFLLLGLIFYCRHFIARWLFSDQLRGTGHPRSRPWLPLLLIAITIGFIAFYQETIVNSVAQQRRDNEANGSATVPLNTEDILEKTDLQRIHDDGVLAFFYIGIFVAAECSFIFMALKEYLQDLLGISEMSLIRGAAVSVETAIDSESTGGKAEPRKT